MNFIIELQLIASDRKGLRTCTRVVFVHILAVYLMLGGDSVAQSNEGRFRVYVPEGVKIELANLGCAKCEVD